MEVPENSSVKANVVAEELAASCGELSGVQMDSGLKASVEIWVILIMQMSSLPSLLQVLK